MDLGGGGDVKENGREGKDREETKVNGTVKREYVHKKNV
jgi:hypothetical protein